MTIRRWVKSREGYRDATCGADGAAELSQERWVGYSMLDLAEKPCDTCPAMPVRVKASLHRRKRCDIPPISALVARTVSEAELKACGRAMGSTKKEWDKLVSKDCFMMDTVSDWKDVRKRARQECFKTHIGRVFGIYVE